jgi:hypothetical protein
MLGPLATARRDPELHSGGRPEAAAAADRLDPCPSGSGKDESKAPRRSVPGVTRGA